MNDLISRLGSFLNSVVPKTAAISVPGILGALALAVLIWPPSPHDEVPCVTNLQQVEQLNGINRSSEPKMIPPVSCAPVEAEVSEQSSKAVAPSKKSNPTANTDSNSQEATTAPASSSEQSAVSHFSMELRGVCEFQMRSLKSVGKYRSANESDQKEPANKQDAEKKVSNAEEKNWSPAEAKTIAFQNQEILDNARRDMEECITLESSHVGEESNDIENLKYQIGVKEKERDSLQAQYLAYRKSGSPLENKYGAEFDTAEKLIEGDQRQVVEKQADLRKRQAHIDLENQFLKEISARVNDPGRIRPSQSFDDFLTGLSNHVLGFAILAVVAGLVLDPITAAVFGGLFDGVLMDWWNRLRKRRPMVYRYKRRSPAGATGTVGFMAAPPGGIGGATGTYDDPQVITIKVRKKGK